MDRMNILFLVQEFYAVEALYVLATTVQDSGFEPMRHSHDRWLSDLREFRQKYARKLADCIYDYTVTVVAGELRHCSKNATYYLDDFFTHDDSRDSVYNNCFDYAPEDILKAGAVMFNTCQVKWLAGYGGDKWKDIALAGLMRGIVCDIVFIDHCVDLSHNSNNYFDKGAGIFMMGSDPIYKAFLEHKRYCMPQCLVAVRLGYCFNRLLERANALGIVNVKAVSDGRHDERTKHEALLLDYQPKVWGTKRIDYSEQSWYASSSYESSRRDDDYRRCENERVLSNEKAA